MLIEQFGKNKKVVLMSNYKEYFSKVHSTNGWHGVESLSVTGSDLVQTAAVREGLPHIFKSYDIASMLDIPCGDFYWMRHVDFTGVDYLGADIVDAIVEKNKQYTKGAVNFAVLDLIKDELPCADLVFCRDCLVHLSFADAAAALKNIVKSRSKYLLTTSFTNRETNEDISTTGYAWRTLNLELEPFALPKPLFVLNENCTEGGGDYADKSLCLWRVNDLRGALNA